MPDQFNFAKEVVIMKSGDDEERLSTKLQARNQALLLPQQ